MSPDNIALLAAIAAVISAVFSAPAAVAGWRDLLGRQRRVGALADRFRGEARRNWRESNLFERHLARPIDADAAQLIETSGEGTIEARDDGEWLVMERPDADAGGIFDRR